MWKPETDEKPLWNLIFGRLGYTAVATAHRLGLFALVAAEPRTLSQVCTALGIEPRPARALLTLSVAAGLCQVEAGVYRLTPTGTEYLAEASPAYFGGFLDMLIASDGVMSVESCERAVRANLAQVYGGQELFASHEAQAELARAFTRGMHGHSAGAAMAWPSRVDLSSHRVLLDVGGGSGIHAIGAALHWPELQGVVLDLAPVCDVAREMIARWGLQGRIATYKGDMWQEPFPPADVHFYADIFHDWPSDACRTLARKSHAALPRGGRILLHEMLYDDGGVEPLGVAAYNVAMLLWTRGQQYSGRELTTLLAAAGFADIEVHPTLGYWSVVSGLKR